MTKYHGDMLTETDVPRLDTWRGRVLAVLRLFGASKHWVTTGQIIATARHRYGDNPCREDTPRRMISYLRADGWDIQARRTEGGVAEYRLMGRKGDGQREMF